MATLYINIRKNTMADNVARREARRRKILDNSKNRLKLITGESTDLNYATNQIENNVPLNVSTIIENTQNKEIENETYNSLLNATKCLHGDHQNELDYLLAESFLEEQPALKERNEFFLEQSSTSINVNSSFSAPYPKTIFITLLAIIIRFLFIFQMQFCLRDSIIYPFIIAEITLQLLNKDSNNSSNPFISTALLLSSLPPEQVNRLMRILNFIESFTKDFSLYFFTFLTVHLFLEIFM